MSSRLFIWCLRLTIVTLQLFICYGQYQPCISYGSHAAYVGDGMCFKVYNNKRTTASSAKSACAWDGGALVELRTQRQHDWAVEAALSFTPIITDKRGWIGASDFKKESSFMWNSKGDPMMVPDSWWLDGQPDDHFGDQDCLTMLWFGQLDDYRCDAYTDNVMCQKYVENPCDSFLPGSDYFDNTCFLPIMQAMTLEQAQEKCEADGARVAEPKSADAKLFFEAFVSDKFGAATVFIGATKMEGGDWLWTDSDEPIVSPHWLNVTDSSTGLNSFPISSIVRKGTKDSNGQLIWSWVIKNAANSGYFVCAKDISQECAGMFAQGSCFTFNRYERSWEQAKDTCERYGAYLAEPKTEALALALDDYLAASNAGQADVWLGGSDAHVEGDFIWTHYGDKVTYSNWYSGFPKGTSGKNDFIMWQSGKWLDRPLTDMAYFVCQQEMAVTTVVYAAYLPVKLTDLDQVQFSMAMQTSDTTAPQFAHMRISSNGLGSVVKRNVYSHRGYTITPFIGVDPHTLDIDAAWLVVNSSAQIDLVMMVQHSSTAVSSLIYPVGWVPYDAFFLNQNQISHDIYIMSTSGYTTDVDLGLFDYNEMVEAQLEQVRVSSRSYKHISSTLRHQMEVFHVGEVSKLSKAPFVFASRSISVFSRGFAVNIRPEDFFWSKSETFEQVLPAAVLGLQYITFPSLPPDVARMDEFTAVAVYNDTSIMVDGARAMPLMAGDTREILLPASEFHLITGTKPFYLYSRLRNHQAKGCTLSLLPSHLCRSSYSFHLDGKWTQMDVYVVIIIRAADLVYLTGLDGDRTCKTVEGTGYMGCYKLLPRESRLHTFRILGSSGVMAAYVFASDTSSWLCHQMGVRSILGSTSWPSYNGELHLGYLEVSSQIPEVMETTTSCPTLTFPPAETTTNGEETTPQQSLSGGLPVNSVPGSAQGETTQGETTQEQTTQQSQQTTLVTEEPPQDPLTTTNPNPQTTTPIGTESPPTVTTGSGCMLSYSDVNLTAEELQTLLEATSAALRVDKRSTSMSRRGRESAPDSRVSSVACGLFSIALIMTTLGVIILSDVYSHLSRWLCRVLGGPEKGSKETFIG